MKFIKRASLMKELAKIDGLSLERVNSAIVRVSRHGRVKLSLYGATVDGDTISMGVIHSPQTDIMTDCFCDTYLHTIRGIVDAINS